MPEPRIYEFTIPCPDRIRTYPYGLMSQNTRAGHWGARRDVAAYWRRMALAHARRHRLPHMNRAHIVVTVHKPHSRKYDAGNLYPVGKALVDGLVDHGLVPDDDNAHVVGPDMRAGPRADNRAYLTITITELED